MRCPEASHAGSWGFTLLRSTPRGRLMLYVPPTPATQEAGALGFGFRLSCGAGRKAKNNFPLPQAPKSAVVVVSVSVLPRGPPREGLLYVAQKRTTRNAGALGFGFGCGGGAARGSKRGATSPFLTAPSLQCWLCWCWCRPNARHTRGGGVCDATLPRGPPRGRRLPRSPPRGRLDL